MIAAPPVMPPSSYRDTVVAAARSQQSQGFIATQQSFIKAANSLAYSPKTAFWERENRYARLNETLSSAMAIKDGWDGYDAPTPNERASIAARAALYKVKKTALIPYSILPSADGGFGITFRGRNSRRAILEFRNDGSATCIMFAKNEPLKTFDVLEDGAFQRAIELITERL